MMKLRKHSSPLLMKLLMKLFSKKTASLVKLSCAKRGSSCGGLEGEVLAVVVACRRAGGLMGASSADRAVSACSGVRPKQRLFWNLEEKLTEGTRTT
jgi:hypothetical protein